MLNDAKNYASEQADIFKQSLQYLVEQQNQQKILDEQALNQRYTDLVNQVNQKRLPIEQQYSQDAQGVYVNKMLGGEQIRQNLSRMGLNSSGFGLTQQALNETAYGQNLSNLMMNRNNQLTGLENQIANLQGQQQADMLGLQSTYAGRLGDLNKYIGESVDKKYQQEYNNYIAQKQYEDRLKQQAIDNTYRANALKNSGGNITFSDTPITKEPVVDSRPKTTTSPTETNHLYKSSTTPIGMTKKAIEFYNTLTKAQFKNGKHVGVALSELDRHIQLGVQNGIYNKSDVEKILNAFNRAASSSMSSGGGFGGVSSGGGGGGMSGGRF